MVSKRAPEWTKHRFPHPSKANNINRNSTHDALARREQRNNEVFQAAARGGKGAQRYAFHLNLTSSVYQALYTHTFHPLNKLLQFLIVRCPHLRLLSGNTFLDTRLYVHENGSLELRSLSQLLKPVHRFKTHLSIRCLNVHINVLKQFS